MNGERDKAFGTTTGLPVTAPKGASEEVAPFWAATAAGEWRLPRCNRCATWVWYPRQYCPACASTDVTWATASGTGTVYSFTVVPRGQGRWAEVAPYVIAFVELAEGPRVLTNLACTPEEARIGMAVRVVFDDTGEGSALYRFVPA